MAVKSNWREELAGNLKGWSLVDAYDHPWFSGRVVGMHSHEFYQLDYLSEGVGEVAIDNDRHHATEGDLFVINPGQKHAFYASSEDPMNLITLKFCPIAQTDAITFPNHVINLSLLSRNQRAEFENTLRRCSVEKQCCSPENALLAEAYLSVSFALLLRYLRDVEELVQPDSQPGACERAMEYIQKHYDEPMTLADIARVAGLHPQYFSHKFTTEMGLSPMAALTKVRIEAASRLLSYTGLPIAEVGLRVGFQDAYYFSRRFKEWQGASPMEYRRREVMNRG